MANFGGKSQVNPKTASFASSFDQLKELTKIPGEGLKELFGVGRNQKQNPQEEVLFDGDKARKKAERGAEEVKNQQKIASLQQELAKIAQEQQALRGQLTEISQTVVQIAKSTQLEVPHDISKIPQRPGVYHKVFYLRILEDIRKKADEARVWQATQQVRVSSKPARGSLLWVGDQKKVHEAGAMFLLQG